jgi:hypothetical protein
VGKQLNAILRLRRDNYYNYEKIKDSFVPANGEICLVDTARDGLRAVCGDGVHSFGELNFIIQFHLCLCLQSFRWLSDQMLL